jgi:hypothetical protein
MSLRRGAGAIAAALTISAATATPAVARLDNSYFPPYTPVIHHSGDSVDWPLIAVVGVGGVTAVGLGIGSRRRSHATQLAGRSGTSVQL